MNDCVVSWFCLASQTSYNLRVRAGRTHLAKLIWPSRGEQRAAKFIHKGARDLSPYDVGEDFEPLRVISRISRILPNPRAEALRDVHDTFHVSLHERKYGVIQNGKWVVPLVETRRGVEGARPQRDGCVWHMGCLHDVGNAAIVAYWERCLWGKYGVRDLERARENDLRDSRVG